MLIVVAPPLFEGRQELTLHSKVKSEADRRGIRKFVIEPPVERVFKGTDDDWMAHYYSWAVPHVLNNLNDGDIVFWGDAWHPGLPMVWQYQSAKRWVVKHYGVFHCDPACAGEYLSGIGWAGSYSRHLLINLNGVFVGSTQVKRHLCSSLACANNVHVTGLPVNVGVVKEVDKDYAICFPHRWTNEKRPDLFLELAGWWVGSVKDDLQFRVITTDSTLNADIEGVNVIICKDKQEYLDEMSKCKYVWSYADLESFGYSVVEGYYCGCIPVLNNHPTYVEYFPNSVYANFQEQVDLIHNSKYENVECRVPLDSIERMFDIMYYGG